jgi:hypothetical protein
MVNPDFTSNPPTANVHAAIPEPSLSALLLTTALALLCARLVRRLTVRLPAQRN